jgi:hypothetical protein
VNHDVTVANRFEDGDSLGVRQALQRRSVYRQDLIAFDEHINKKQQQNENRHVNMKINWALVRFLSLSLSQARIFIDFPR